MNIFTNTSAIFWFTFFYTLAQLVQLNSHTRVIEDKVTDELPGEGHGPRAALFGIRTDFASSAQHTLP